MTKLYDVYVKPGKEVQKKGVELGWSKKSYQMDKNNIETRELSRIKESARTSNADLQVYSDKADKKLLRDISKLSCIDIILNPGLEMKERGIDKVIAENAKENNVKFVFTFTKLAKMDNKERIRAMSDIRDWVRICEKYNSEYMFATGAENPMQLRSPHNIKKFVERLGGRGKKAIQDWPASLIRQVMNE